MLLENIRVKETAAVLFGSGENTGGLDDVISTDRAPRDLSGILLSVNGDRLALDPELSILGLDGSLESSVDGIILEHVDLRQKSDMLFLSPNLH
jgi:hypothetical protein